ncbi:MAG: sulfatase-like hydrolase/transferase [Hungatella hathewayi]|nr:sulfatase-like hydrolase/transferase [Hungatella hathewayi]
MERPNMIFYFTDQQRWDTIGCYGQKLDVTPNLDRLAGDGVVFEEAYTAQPVCGPCRALFQTGKYPLELGCYKNNIALPPDVKTVADYLEESGYETAYVGKWHLASGGNRYGEEKDDYKTEAVPLNRRGGYRGFWRASDVLEFTSHGYGGYVFDENGNRHDFTGYRSDCITDYALEFLDGYDGEKPFFMTISQIEPHHQNDHDRYEGPDGSKERFGEFELPPDLKLPGSNAAEEYPDYLGCCRSLDENLGRLVEKLREKGLYENTVIVFASDHGSHFKTRNRDEHLNGYDDYKRSCHSGCLHVPLVIAGPGWRGGRRIKNLVSTASLPKTWLAMAEIDVGDGMIGEDLRDVADGRTAGRREEIYAQISESRVGRCIRTPEYLYAVYAPGMDGREAGRSDVYRDDFLYDLRKDPYELVNVVYEEEYRAVRDEMAERLLALMEEAGESGARIQL